MHSATVLSDKNKFFSLQSRLHRVRFISWTQPASGIPSYLSPSIDQRKWCRIYNTFKALRQHLNLNHFRLFQSHSDRNFVVWNPMKLPREKSVVFSQKLVPKPSEKHSTPFFFFFFFPQTSMGMIELQSEVGAKMPSWKILSHEFSSPVNIFSNNVQKLSTNTSQILLWHAGDPDRQTEISPIRADSSELTEI